MKGQLVPLPVPIEQRGRRGKDLYDVVKDNIPKRLDNRKVYVRFTKDLYHSVRTKGKYFEKNYMDVGSTIWTGDVIIKVHDPRLNKSAKKIAKYLKRRGTDVSVRLKEVI